MWKYFALMFVVLGLAVFYVYIKDPCNQQVRTDFSKKYPTYAIVDSAPTEGGPERIRCQISYRKPGSEQVFEDIWLYLHAKRGWEFGGILEAEKVK